MRRARVLVDGTAHLDPTSSASGDGRRSRPGTRLDHRPAACAVAQAVSGGRPRRRQDPSPTRGGGSPGRVGGERRRGPPTCCLLDLPPDVAAAARERIDYLARRLPSDERTMDQRRADVAVDLLCGHSKPLGRGMVDLTVDLRTLLGFAEDPGDAGRVGTGDRRHRPPGHRPATRWPLAGHRHRRQRRPLRGGGAAPPHRIPGPPSQGPAPHLRVPRMPPTRPLLRPRPHPTPHRRRTHPRREPGSTVQFHHRAKDEGGWDYRRRPNGDHIWTSPHGHTYVTSGRSP